MSSQLVRLEQDMCRDSLHVFARLAWRHVEPSTFVDNWHLGAIAEFCEDLTRGTFYRGVINVPPGMGKSLMTGVFWPAWVWGPLGMPWIRWFYASFDQGLMNRDASKLINLLRSPWYQARWGNLIPPGNVGTTMFENNAGGFRFSTSFGGKGTGRHAHFQVIDDPIKPKDANGSAAISGKVLDRTWEIYENTFASRAIEPKEFRRLIIGQRVHEEDPSGRALSTGNYAHLRLPMRYEAGEDADLRDKRTTEGEWLFPARFDQSAADKLEVSEETWQTQYQQRPSTPGGSILKEDWIDRFSVTPDLVPAYGYSAQSWDFAFKGEEVSDFVAGQYWRSIFYNGVLHHFGLIDDPIFERATFLESIGLLRTRRERWECNEILIEAKANGIAIENALQHEFSGLLRLVEPKGPKVSRAHACAPKLATGRVHLVRGPRYEEHKKILSRFPRVRRDDPVDGFTQYILEAEKTSLLHEAMRNI